ncbi:hypothetical protein FOH10_29470 [Nocardia otitidiscaviarum]|uniref:Uncharacterized protein n=1 Tax=Nocardia otitidiscaviarum TaxID=1823 RepID=A0A516NTL2_9NOCA|nr:hypothetical protein [Nocardia otitidiscaviarum]MCP9621583.1 hypothetical protein [Nocardia otitidiscaviarum]QDP82249.1 hypothetical protein FOH10_29470 [Nocardia otitidiscaviarum]
MSTADDLRQELHALSLERSRLRQIDVVLTDMLDAASAVQRSKGYVNDAAEREKLRHWDEVHASVWNEQWAASDRERDTFDRYFVESTAEARRRIASQSREVREISARVERSR